MASELESEAAELAGQCMELVQEFEEEDTEVGFDDFKAAKKAAEMFRSQNSPLDWLRASLKALEEVMASTKHKEKELLARLREVQWAAKDAGALFKDADDNEGRVAALSALCRSHLLRAAEPDAPPAALKAAKEADELCRNITDDRIQAEVLLLVAQSHIAIAVATPYTEVLTEEVNHAAEASRTAEGLYRQLEDRRGLAQAMHITAKAMLRHTDEDEALDGERIADEAIEIFQELKDTASEVAVLLTSIAARNETSGPESALMLASDAAQDWQEEGSRPRDVALALLLAATFRLDLNEHAAALEDCTEAQVLYEKSGDRRGVATALETKAAVFCSQKRYDEAVQALEELANVFQRMGDKKAQGKAYMMTANMLLNQLSDEVETDTQAEFDKKPPKVGISSTDVQKRTDEGLQYANKASKVFEEIDDEEGKQGVADLIQGVHNKAIQLYCRTNEPDMIYYMQNKDTPQMDESKVIKEWKIPMPALAKTDGVDQGDGFLHIFDPHPPPKM